jgi:hypothetical protein
MSWMLKGTTQTKTDRSNCSKMVNHMLSQRLWYTYKLEKHYLYAIAV